MPPTKDVSCLITFSFNVETSGQWEFALSYDARIASARAGHIMAAQAIEKAYCGLLKAANEPVDF